ncbi:MAG: hypothetical protein ACOCXT_05255 [Candidatus Dojkabacteria bacterium]
MSREVVIPYDEKSELISEFLSYPGVSTGTLGLNLAAAGIVNQITTQDSFMDLALITTSPSILVEQLIRPIWLPHPNTVEVQKTGIVRANQILDQSIIPGVRLSPLHILFGYLSSGPIITAMKNMVTGMYYGVEALREGDTASIKQYLDRITQLADNDREIHLSALLGESTPSRFKVIYDIRTQPWIHEFLKIPNIGAQKFRSAILYACLYQMKFSKAKEIGFSEIPTEVFRPKELHEAINTLTQMNKTEQAKVVHELTLLYQQLINNDVISLPDFEQIKAHMNSVLASIRKSIDTHRLNMTKLEASAKSDLTTITLKDLANSYKPNAVLRFQAYKEDD